MSRQSSRYKTTAEKLGIPVDVYMSQGQSGKRFCSKCRVWKKRPLFLEYDYTKTHYSGICQKCRGVKVAPKNIAVRGSWGPALAASARINVPVKEYLTKRAAGQRWCTDHKGWFDASHIISKPDYHEQPITRCYPCNRSRQVAYRLVSKNEKLSPTEGKHEI